MMDEHANTVKIAVLEEQIKGIREQQSAHAKDTRERFDIQAEDTRERFDAQDKKLDIMNQTLGELLAAFNKGKGAYAVLFILSGAIGAAVIKVASMFMGWMKQ